VTLLVADDVRHSATLERGANGEALAQRHRTEQEDSAWGCSREYMLIDVPAERRSECDIPLNLTSWRINLDVYVRHRTYVVM